MIDIEWTIEQYNRTIDDIDSMMPKKQNKLNPTPIKEHTENVWYDRRSSSKWKQGKEKIQFPDGVTIAKIEMTQK